MTKSKLDNVVTRLPENGVLKIDPRNVRVHGRENKKRIKQSLEAIGAGRGILADGENIIRAGNGIYEQAKKLGFKFKIVDVDDKTILVSRRPDLRGKRAVRAAMLDNLASDSSAYDYDADILADVVNNDALLKSIAADDERLQELLGIEDETPNDDEHAAALVDKAAELQKKWKVKLGDLWECGEHRIVCGDCTDKVVVDKVMKGEKGHVCLTDPPYGVGMEYGMHEDDPYKNESLIIAAFSFSPKSRVWTPGLKNLARELLREPSAGVLAWNRKFSVGWPAHACSWATVWEPVLVVSPKGKTKTDHFEYMTDRFTVDDKPLTKLHPCPKALGLWVELLKGFSKQGDLVYDPFLGSGTTMIACENLNRKCRAIEINPAYVAVSLQRWADLTGQKPKRL